MHAFWNNFNLKPPKARKLAVRHTSFVCLTDSFQVTGGFLKLFHKIPWFFLHFSGSFQIPWFFDEFLHKYVLHMHKVILTKVCIAYAQSNKVAKIRNRYNQVPHLTQDTNGKVTNSKKTPQTRAKRSALSQQVTTKHI